MASGKSRLDDIKELAEQQLGSDEANRILDRSARIVKTSIIGIAANVFLALFKVIVGLASHSIAIVMDAVNNLSDAASSVVTIVGTKLAGKDPDKKHPFGHGRIEYLSAMLISVLVIYAGLAAFEESVKKILYPDVPEYSGTSLAIIAVAVLVKIVLGRYVRRVGEEVHSDSLVNSGKDAGLDAIISASTLVAAVIFIFFHISLEAWLGAIISVIIIKSGIDMLRETISQLLGEGADAELARSIKSTITSYPQISGAYDLVLHNYGPDTYNGSVHIAVDDTLSAADLDKLIRTVTLDVYRKHDVILNAIGVYSVNTIDPEAVEAREKISKIVLSHEYVLEMHGFYFDKEEESIRFDIVISFDAPDRHVVFNDIVPRVQKLYPDYKILAAMDTDFSEL